MKSPIMKTTRKLLRIPTHYTGKQHVKNDCSDIQCVHSEDDKSENARFAYDYTYRCYSVKLIISEILIKGAIITHPSIHDKKNFVKSAPD